jgi:adenosylcobinamide-GDP ribazoletransferase
MNDGLRLAVGTCTVVPVRPPRTVDRKAGRDAMLWAPLVGVALGWVGGGVVWLGDKAFNSSYVAAASALAILAGLTRGMHLDGLADTADGLGSAKAAEKALDVMRRSDIGPFGVVTLVLTLLVQFACIAAAPWWGLAVAVPAGRLASTLGCVRGVPAARTDGLGATVAGSVPPAAYGAFLVVMVAYGVAIAGWFGLIAVLVSMGTAGLLLRRCVSRLGGITGDVLGALIEVATTAALIVLAAS